MAAEVNKEKCTGCETCVGECPVSAISMVDGKASVNAGDCLRPLPKQSEAAVFCTISIQPQRHS